MAIVGEILRELRVELDPDHVGVGNRRPRLGLVDAGGIRPVDCHEKCPVRIARRAAKLKRLSGDVELARALTRIRERDDERAAVVDRLHRRLAIAALPPAEDSGFHHIGCDARLRRDLRRSERHEGQKGD